MIYFDNAATSFPKAPGVTEAMARFLAEDAANPGRAGHRMAVAAEQMLDDTRLKLTRFFDGDDLNRMVFALNGTDALNMAIKGVLGPAPAPGTFSGGLSTRSKDVPHVITTVLEHNSVSRPLEAMARTGAIELTRVTCDDDGFVDPDDVRRAITAATTLIVMTHASNVLGTIQDVAAIGRIAREHDVLFCVDAAQTAGVVPISVREMCIDLLAFPGHKSLLGPTGTGALYVGERCPKPQEIADAAETGATAGTSDSRMTGDVDASSHQRVTAGTQPGAGAIPGGNPGAGAGAGFMPWREGGTGGDSSTPTQPGLMPYYLEGGTPNTVGIAGLSAALDYLAQHQPEQHLRHEQAMVAKIIERFDDDDRITIHGCRDASKHVGTVSLNVNDYDAPDVGSILDDSFEIAVRPGLHCAPYTHRRLGTYPSGTVRISPGPFNTDDDLAVLLDALDQIAG